MNKHTHIHVKHTDETVLGCAKFCVADGDSDIVGGEGRPAGGGQRQTEPVRCSAGRSSAYVHSACGSKSLLLLGKQDTA